MSKKEESVRAISPAPIMFIIYCALGLVLSIILSFLSAMLISAEKLPASSVEAVASVSAFFGVLFASFMSAKKFGKAIFSALLQGLIFFLALYLTGTIFFGRLIPVGASLWVFLACLVGSVFSGMLAACGKKRRH